MTARDNRSRIGWGECRIGEKPLGKTIEIRGAGVRIAIEDVGAPSSRLGEIISRALQNAPEIFDKREDGTPW